MSGFRCGRCGERSQRCYCTAEQMEAFRIVQNTNNKKITRPKRDNLPFGGAMRFQKRSVARGDRR